MHITINDKRLNLSPRVVGAIGLLIQNAEEIESFQNGHVQIDFARPQASLSVHTKKPASVSLGKRLADELNAILLDKQCR